MKIAGLLLFAVIPIYVLPQELIDESKTWNVVECCSPSRTKSYKFLGDTLINSIVYKKLYYSYSENFNSLNKEYAASLREDNQKVYIKPSTLDESIIYDFNVDYGDTITVKDIFDIDGDLTMRVDSIDSININSKLRRRIFFEDIEPYGNFEPQIWIESIGSSYGIIEVTFPHIPDMLTDLLCVKQNSSIIFNAYGTCYMVDDIKEVVDKNELQIFPNPSSDFIIIKPSSKIQGKLIKVNISNNLGQVIYMKENVDQIDISAFPKGLYIIEILDKHKTIIKISKFIKL